MSSLIKPKNAEKMSNIARNYDQIKNLIINNVLNPIIIKAANYGFRHASITSELIQQNIPEYPNVLSFKDIEVLIQDAIKHANSGAEINDIVYRYYANGISHYIYWGECGNILKDDHTNAQIYLIRDNDLPE